MFARVQVRSMVGCERLRTHTKHSCAQEIGTIEGVIVGQNDMEWDE